MNWTREDVVRNLKKVREDLVTGKITDKQFDMDVLLLRPEPNHCGTVGCIAGWLVMHRAEEQPLWKRPIMYMEGDYIDRAMGGDSDSLNALFYNYPMSFTLRRGHAVQAIDAYLAGAESPWDGIEQ